MAVPKAKKIYHLKSPYRVNDYEKLIFPTWLQKIWPYNAWIMRFFAFMLFVVYIAILLMMYGYEPKGLVLNYSRLLLTSNPLKKGSLQFSSQSYGDTKVQDALPHVGGIEINTNRKRNVKIFLLPGGYELKPGRFSLVPAGGYTLQIKGSGILEISKKIYISKSVVYKDYFYLLNNPVELEPVASLKGKFFVKQVGEKIIACNNDYLLIFSPGIERYLDIVNYRIYSAVFAKNKIAPICNNIKQAKLIFINSPRNLSLVVLEKHKELHSTTRTKQDLIFVNYSFSENIKRNFNVTNSLTEAFTHIKVVNKKLHEIPFDYKLRNLDNKFLAYPNGVRLNESITIFVWDAKTGRLLNQKKLSNFYGKIDILNKSLYILSFEPNVSKLQLNLTISLFEKANLQNTPKIYTVNLPYQLVYDAGFVTDYSHLYLLNSQGNLLILTSKDFEIEDNNIKQYLQKQVKLNREVGLLAPFIYSTFATGVKTKVLQQSNLNIKEDKFKNLYKYTLNKSDFERITRKEQNNFETIINNNFKGQSCSLLLDDKLICPATFNIASLIPGVYKIKKPQLYNSKNKNLQVNMSMVSDSLLVFYSTEQANILKTKKVEYVDKNANKKTAYKLGNMYVNYLGLNKLYPLDVVFEHKFLINGDDRPVFNFKEIKFLGLTNHNVNVSLYLQNTNSTFEQNNKQINKNVDSGVTLLLTGKL